MPVDQCGLIDERFTLLAPDDYRSDYLDIKLWDGRGRESASESLYVEDDEEDEGEEAELEGGGPGQGRRLGRAGSRRPGGRRRVLGRLLQREVAGGLWPGPKA